MAVNKLKKIEILGHQSLHEEVINTLQKLGIVQIVDFKNNISIADDLVEIREIETKDVDITLQQINYCLNFHKRFEKKKSLLEKLKEAPKIINYNKLAGLVQSFDFSHHYNQCQELESQLNSAHAEEAKIKTEINFWQPWNPIEANVKDLEHTEQCAIIAGIVRSDHEETLLQEVKDTLTEVDVTIVNHEKNKSYLLFIVNQEIQDGLSDFLKQYEFQEIKFLNREGKPAAIIEQLNKQLQKLQKDLETLQHKAQDLLKEKEKCLMLYDYYTNLQTKQKLSQYIAHTQQVFSLVGWLKAKDEQKILHGLEKKFHELDIIIKEPDADEVPPVDLINKKIVSPFEAITNLYGLPNYKEVDPTPLLAPFFFLFFGVCLTDAGYGLILSLACILSLRYFYLQGGTKKMVQLFFLCGISTFICGVLTGGWFGDILNYMPAYFAPLRNLKNSLILIDPIKEPLKFLIFALVLGFIQVWCGVGVQMYKDIKTGELQNAFLSRLPWLVLLPGMIMLLLVKGNILQGEIWAALGKWLSIIPAGTLFLFEGRAHKNIFGRFGTGLLALYGIVGYYADMLSYCRLLALGLATAVIANVVNQMAFLTMKIPYVGIIMMACILIGGHIFNLAINLLGAFVHTSRLQFIEFFTKFFEGGGKPFVPFAIKTKYISIEEN